MPGTSIGWVHFVLAIAAIGAGAAVALARKGTSRHRQLGRTYGFLLIGVNVTAFMIYGLFGRFGPFHISAVISLITVLAGWIPARRRSPHAWVVYHAYFMSWSYVGLLAAAAAETLSRIPDSPFWGMVIAASLGIVALGGIIVHRRLPAILAPFGRARVRRAHAAPANLSRVD